MDGYTRMAYACMASRRTTDGALVALQAAQLAFGFPFQRVLTDNDLTFAWTPRTGLRAPVGGIRHRTKKIRRP